MKGLIKNSGIAVFLLLSFTCFSFAQQKYDVRNFNGISVGIAADIQVYQASDFKLEIKAQQKIIDEISVNVDDGILYIKNKENNQRHKMFDDDDVIIRVWAPVYNLISVHGSGDVIAMTTLESNEIKFKVSGSGDIDVPNLLAAKVVVSINGSGDVEIKGEKVAESLQVSISGSGDVSMKHFACKNVKLIISGSSDVEINATETLSGSVNGSSDIVAYGNALLNVDVTGSGSIKQVR